MTHHRSWDEMEKIGRRFIARSRQRGVSEPVAKEIFSYIHAYAGYGFCEAHAAAFADTAYKSAYLMAHHPADFYAALLSHQPMGFWPPNTLVWEAKRKGIAVLGPDINRSRARFTVEDGALRVSLPQIQGMGEASLDAILQARKRGGPFTSLADFCRRVHGAVQRDLIRSMILCGAFDSLHPNRRQALWDLDQALADASDEGILYSSPFQGEGRVRVAGAPDAHGNARPAGCTPSAGEGSCSPLTGEDRGGGESRLPDFSPREKWRHEFEILGIALGRHPLSFARARLGRQGVIAAAEAKRGRSGTRVKVAGMVIRPHRPPTKSGRTVVFLTLEDETGLLDVTVFESVYQKCGKAIFTQPVLLVAGRLDHRGAAHAPASLIADHIA
jgi:error-prone DNA polymerase